MGEENIEHYWNYFGLYPYISRLNNIPEFPLCSHGHGVSGNCFNGNTCFIQDDMNLIRNITVTDYHILLESFVTIKKNFGIWSSFLQVSGIMNKEFLI